MKRFVLLIVAMGVVGCTHVATPRYYTLDMTSSGTAVSKYNIEIEQLRPNEALARADILIQTSPVEIEYYRNGGILHTVLRKMATGQM